MTAWHLAAAAVAAAWLTAAALGWAPWPLAVAVAAFAIEFWRRTR